MTGTLSKKDTYTRQAPETSGSSLSLQREDEDLDPGTGLAPRLVYVSLWPKLLMQGVLSGCTNSLSLMDDSNLIYSCPPNEKTKTVVGREPETGVIGHELSGS